MSALQNRTHEFQQCVASFDKINKNKPGTRQQQRVPPRKSQFSQQASVIAKDIAHTTELLLKLALLAKRKPLFDDRPVEIGELTYVIKQDIFKIEQSIQSLQRHVRGGPQVPVDSQISQNLKNVLNLLNSKMKNVSGEFKAVLELRQRNELANKSRKENFLSAALTGRPNAQPAVLGGAHHLANLGENPYLMADAPEPAAAGGADLLSIPDQTRQLLLMEEQSSEYLQQRSLAVETIEATINEVGNLFLQLATMVTEQGEAIQRIDQNVEDIDMNISGAQRELLKYYAHISSNRWMFLKVFGVLLVFFFLWVVVS
ncbi:t-SNARE [Metschnikowia bicuspidata var. bicuspidata NRRL YB-4993]|uniref:t-SNARE n=1 Tax=Metschnikowia bicuspidata var. bicuspidata NRRL YB-4993 TaxID=869754 RepID=A0A1A0H9C3_9ASCO|nr:t-SNARE [Metschnikowia bicuspidata var. bicuspidata NRRL YB-4993]OBA20719.1 t-SNARE [Metschnikowia bicuspidata var. bicuspidata NRRL YB-4993]